MGGPICEVFVTRYRQKVARLVLVDAIPQRLTDERFPYGQDPASAPEIKKALEDNYDATCALFGERISPENKQVGNFVADIARRTRPDVAINDYASTDARSQLDLLPEINLPTTIICGEHDLVCKPEASFFMAERIPGCTSAVKVVRDAGHAPFLARSEYFNTLLLEAASV